MTRYEYQTLTLVGDGEHSYYWQSCRSGRCGSHETLSALLNTLGAAGWHIVSHVSDGRFGNQILMQRGISD